MVTIIVDNRLRLHDLEPSEREALVELFTHENPKGKMMRARKMKGWWNEPLLLPTWGEVDGVLHLPRGGMAKVRTCLEERGTAYRVQDRRQRGVPIIFPEPKVEMWPHQVRIIDACMKRENCLVKSSTGSGKTSALLALVSRMKCTTLVIVHSNALLQQWRERAEAELGIPIGEVGIVGDGKERIHPLTVGTLKSVLQRVSDPTFRNYWGAVLCDEVHLFAAQTFFSCVDPIPARYRIGVSDDQRRKDKKEFLIYDQFGAVAEEVSHEEMVKMGHVMDVEVLLVPTEFDAPWYTGEDGERSPDYMRLVSEMSTDADRNAIVEGILRRELADKRQCLVFAREREHCRNLGSRAAQYARAGYLIGGAGADRQEFDRTRKGLKEGSLRVAVGTLQACGTGVDLPGVEVGIATVPILSNRQMFRQARGRICRKPAGKTVARFYILWDRKVFGLRALENAASWNATTFVWANEQWTPLKAYLKKSRITKKEADDGTAQG